MKKRTNKKIILEAGMSSNSHAAMISQNTISLLLAYISPYLQEREIMMLTG